MSDEEQYVSFLGTGWAFPPRFSGSGAAMTSEADDIHGSLEILFNTGFGERFLVPKYGLAMREIMFEPMSTTLRTMLTDRVKTAILIYEPRIKLIKLTIDSPDPNEGSLQIALEYEIRSTNSRYNLVFPFYRTDSNEVRGTVSGAI